MGGTEILGWGLCNWANRRWSTGLLSRSLLDSSSYHHSAIQFLFLLFFSFTSFPTILSLSSVVTKIRFFLLSPRSCRCGGCSWLWTCWDHAPTLLRCQEGGTSFRSKDRIHWNPGWSDTNSALICTVINVFCVSNNILGVFRAGHVAFWFRIYQSSCPVSERANYFKETDGRLRCSAARKRRPLSFV